MLLFAAGCPSPEPSTPDPQTSAGEEVEPSAPSAPAAAPAPAWLEALASGDRAHVDSARGVVLVRYLSDASGEAPDADEAGMIQTAERLCGPALERGLARLAGDLRMRFEDDAWRSLIACEAHVCTFPALGEYDTTGALRFEGETLDSVVRIEGGPVTEEFRAAGERWAEGELARLAEGGCEP